TVGVGGSGGWVAGESIDECAEIERCGARRIERQSALNGAQRRFVILAQHRDRKRGDSQRRRIIGAARYHGARVPDPGGFVGLMKPGAREENLMAPGEERMGGGV